MTISGILMVAAAVVAVLATVATGIAPVPMVPLALALAFGSLAVERVN